MHACVRDGHRRGRHQGLLQQQRSPGGMGGCSRRSAVAVCMRVCMMATWEGATKASFSSNAAKVGWEGAAAGVLWLFACVCA